LSRRLSRNGDDQNKDSGVSSEDEVRRMRGELEELEAARLRLSKDVMEGKPGALEEDRRLERRLWELADRLMGGDVREQP
jgi:hypothetical protein